MADSVTFQFNYAEIGVFLRSNPELRAYLDDLGRKGVQYARSIAPVGTRSTKYTHPGQYRDSFHYEVKDSKTRMYVRIFSDDFTAWWIEYGSIKVPKYAVLRRTLDFLASGHTQAASAYAGVSDYDARNVGTQGKRRTRRINRAVAATRK